MQKLKLELNDLLVESFDTLALERERGTVQGHEETDYMSCGGTCAPASKCCAPITITEMPTDANCGSEGCTGGIYCTFECPTYAFC